MQGWLLIILSLSFDGGFDPFASFLIEDLGKACQVDGFKIISDMSPQFFISLVQLTGVLIGTPVPTDGAAFHLILKVVEAVDDLEQGDGFGIPVKDEPPAGTFHGFEYFDFDEFLKDFR